MWRVAGVDPSGVRLLVRGKVRASERWRLNGEFRQQVIAALDRAGHRARHDAARPDRRPHGPDDRRGSRRCLTSTRSRGASGSRPRARSSSRSSSSSSSRSSRCGSSRLFVHGVVKTLLDREATEGTAQELSAVELNKRMTRSTALLGSALQFFILVIAGLMVLGQLGSTSARPSPGSASSGSPSGSARRAWSATTSTARSSSSRTSSPRATSCGSAGVAGTVEDFTLRRTTLRDIDGVVHTVPNGEIKVASNLTRVWARINQDVTVAYGTDIDKAIAVVDAVGREMAGRPGLEAAGPGGAARRAGRGAGRVRRHAQDPRHGAGARPVGGRRRAPQAPARRVRGERHRDPAAAAGRPDPRPGGPGPTEDDLSPEE